MQHGSIPQHSGAMANGHHELMQLNREDPPFFCPTEADGQRPFGSPLAHAGPKQRWLAPVYPKHCSAFDRTLQIPLG